MDELRFGFTAQEMISENRVTLEEIGSLKELLRGEENVPELTDEQIVIFLLSCLKIQEDTRKTILAYYSIRNRATNIFNDRLLDREDLLQQLRALRFCVFPQRTEDGRCVIYHRLEDTYYSSYSMEPAMKLLFMTLDAAIFERPPQGLIILFDMKGVGLMHLTRVKLELLKTFFSYVQEALPARLDGVHVLNSVYFIDKVMSIIKPFIKAEVFQQLHFHPSDINMEEFYAKWIPKTCLPQDYGGELPSVDVLHEETQRKIANLKDHFRVEEELRMKIAYKTTNDLDD